VSPAKPRDGDVRGFIIPVGGAEEKVGNQQILKRFLRLAGGKDARIAVIPTASQLADTGERYVSIFRDLGPRKCEVLDFETRDDCENEELLEKLEKATGIFLTGGNQLRLATTLGGTPVAKALRRLNAAGVHVAGTSAGAAFLSEHMIAFGEEGATPHAGDVTLSPGLGLTALAYNPFAVGLGLDEDTGVFIGPDESFEVVGAGAVTVVDPSEVDYSSMDQAEKGDPVCLIGVRLHILTRGAGYDLHTRQAKAPSGATGRG
jgi:cyanophycinase